MIRLSILLVFFFSVEIINAQKIELYTFTNDVSTDINALLTNGIKKADIMNGIKQEPKQMEYMFKMAKSMQENKEWYLDYMQKYSTPPVPYHPNFGLTEIEYKEFLSKINDVEIISTGIEDIEVIKTDNYITFKTKDRLSEYNHIKIRMDSLVIFYDNLILENFSEINVVKSNNGLKTKWKGYRWSHSDNSNSPETHINNMSELNINTSSFLIGQLEKNGNIYIELKRSLIEKGVKLIDIRIPIQFKLK